ncbi:MAG: 16S rRNA (guanine(527)-N(7))-methyltransferase RsmG [Rickettsiaceae bacterium]|nr:16S rRNA (guanine(527)-N(7))-methyltransferase RsmG [Rickettsiaceae bacterium]
MIELSEIYKSKLEDYSNLLKKWNQKINLISKNTESEIWERHILDSLQLLDYLDTNTPIIDLGTGAGLPGIILSICGIKIAYLVESDARKCAFLKVASRISDHNIIILNKRIGTITKSDINLSAKIVSRALASLAKLLEMYDTIGCTQGMLLLKGKNYDLELEEASVLWNFEYNIYRSKTSDQSIVLEIKNVSKKY